MHRSVYSLIGATADCRSQVQDPVGGARHGRGPAVEHVRVDHRGADVVVSQELLDGTNVASVLEQVRGERVPKRMGRRTLPEVRLANGLEYRSLQDGLVQMMATSLAGGLVDIEPCR